MAKPRTLKQTNAMRRFRRGGNFFRAVGGVLKGTAKVAGDTGGTLVGRTLGTTIRTGVSAVKGHGRYVRGANRFGYRRGGSGIPQGFRFRSGSRVNGNMSTGDVACFSRRGGGRRALWVP